VSFVCGDDVEELICCFFVVLVCDADIGSFLVMLMVVFGGDARGGWCWFLVVMLWCLVLVFGEDYWWFCGG